MIEVSIGDWARTQGLYRLEIHLIPEEGGGYSALTVTLPGASSQGDTIPEALANVKESATLSIETYLDLGEEIPWCKAPPPPKIGEGWRAWIFVQLDDKYLQEEPSR